MNDASRHDKNAQPQREKLSYTVKRKEEQWIINFSTTKSILFSSTVMADHFKMNTVNSNRYGGLTKIERTVTLRRLHLWVGKKQIN